MYLLVVVVVYMDKWKNAIVTSLIKVNQEPQERKNEANRGVLYEILYSMCLGIHFCGYLVDKNGERLFITIVLVCYPPLIP